MQKFFFIVASLGFYNFWLIERYPWIMIVASISLIISAYFYRINDLETIKKTTYVIPDKNKGLKYLIIQLCCLIFILTLCMKVIETLPVYIILVAFISGIISIVLSKKYQYKYLFFDTKIVSKNETIEFENITDIQYDDKFLIINTKEYLNHLKIKRNLISDELKSYMTKKYQQSTQQNV